MKKLSHAAATKFDLPLPTPPRAARPLVETIADMSISEIVAARVEACAILSDAETALEIAQCRVEKAREAIALCDRARNARKAEAIAERDAKIAAHEAEMRAYEGIDDDAPINGTSHVAVAQ